MAYRYTNTEKWGDAWFSGLNQLEMLLFIYLCDNCDIAGFVEINLKRWAVDINSNITAISTALKGLQRGLLYSNDGDCLYIRNFLKHQKNLPLQDNNKAHIGIKRRFEIYANKFDIESIDDFIDGASKGLQSTYGIGIGNSIGNGSIDTEPKTITWRDSFDVYLSELNNVYQSLIADKEFIIQRERYATNVDIVLSLEKAYNDFWGTEKGWKYKKRTKTKVIDWKETLTNAIDFNKVYKPFAKRDNMPQEGMLKFNTPQQNNPETFEEI